MTADDFVEAIRGVLRDNCAIYRQLIAGRAEEATDPYWRSVRSLFASLSGEQRETLLTVFDQVAIDTTSNLFGVLDGVCAVDGLSGTFRLTLNGDSIPTGGLQDKLLG